MTTAQTLSGGALVLVARGTERIRPGRGEGEKGGEQNDDTDGGDRDR